MSASDADLAACAAMIARGSKSFALAARLFDDATRNGAISLYAWCRRCDDEIDGSDLGMRGDAPSALDRAASEEKLLRLQDLTRRAYAGERLNDPAFDAFGAMVRRFHVPIDYPLELLEGMSAGVAFVFVGGHCRVASC